MAHSFDTTPYGKRNGAARGALKSSASDVLEDFEELRKDIARLAEAAQKSARLEIESTGARIDHFNKNLRGRAKGSVRFVEDKVRERPATAMGIAMGVGLVLGLALMPKR